MSTQLNKMRILFLLCLVITAFPFMTNAQGRLVLNGGKVNIANGAVLVVSNSASNAITRSSGHIISEGTNNRIRWNIGTTAATYTVPFGSGNVTYFPVTFTTSAASGSGYFDLATVPTPAENSTALPTGVTNFNGATGVDMSLLAVDRFWKIEAQSYTTNPTLSNLIFTYQDGELASPNKTSVENKLTARRWNSTSSSWTDYNTGGTVNTSANTVTITSLSGTNLFPWWTIAYPGNIFHWTTATTSNWNNAANWAATIAGPGGLGVPGPGDAVWFDDARDGGCNIDAAVDVATFTMSAGYSGTVAQGNNTITIASPIDLTGGTFTGGAASVTVNGSINLNGTSFTAPATLDVKQNLNVNAGTFNHNNGTVRFSGANGAQQISGTVTSTFNNIDVTNVSATPGLRFENNANLAGVLSLSANVTVDADGTSDNRVLTLLSTSDDPTRDAAIGILPSGAQVTGKVTVQRHMSIEGPNNTRIYRYIASPVQHGTVADLQQEIIVTGTFTGRGTCSGCGTSQSMFAYNESVITDTNKSGTQTLDDGYIDFPDVANTEEFEPGRGYALFVRGNLQASTRWDLRGAINAGNVTPVTLPMTYTSSGQINDDGWNLVGNPYPSTIDWNAASGWTKTNVGGAIYIRDNANAISRCATWNGVVGTNGGSRYIAMGQAFWVKANGSGVPLLRASENVKAPGTQTTFFREETPTNVFRMILSQGTNSDEAIVHFRSDATEKFDAAADAVKWANNGINISTQMAGEEKLAINSLSKLNCNTTVQVLVENAPKGEYAITFGDLETFNAATTILLTDNFTGATIDTRTQKSYSFAITTDPASAATNRFSLSFSTPAQDANFIVSAPAVCVNTEGIVSLTGSNSLNTYSLFIGDERIGAVKNGAADLLQWKIAKEKLKSGDNDLTIRATPTQCGLPQEKPITLNVIETVSPLSVTDGSICREGSVDLFATGPGEGNIYNWYENETAFDPIHQSTTADFVTPILATSKTYFVAIANALGCEGKRVPVQATVVQYDDAQIIADEDSLHVNFSSGIEWYYNDELIEGAQSPALSLTAFGKYDVKVTIGSCETKASYFSVEQVTAIETDTENLVEVYPNPVVDELHVKLSHELKNVHEVQVRNELGQRVGVFKLTITNDQQTGKFDMTHVASGFYTVEIVTDEKRIPVKIIKK